MKENKRIKPETETLIPHLIESFRRFTKLAGPNDRLQTREFRQTADEVKAIDEKIHSGKGAENEEFYTRSKVASYLLYHWVLHYQQAMSILKELPHTPARVLEVCSGSGPFAFASLRLGSQEAWMIDSNEDALRLGADVIGRFGFPVNTRKWRFPTPRLPVTGNFDAIFLPYCLTELFPENDPRKEEKEDSFIDMCLNMLSPDGFLVIVESSYPMHNKRVLKIRDRFVSKGVAVQAPCVWKGECPALENDKNPCFAQREYEKPFFLKELQRASGIFLGSLKMSYLILISKKASWPNYTQENLWRVTSPQLDSQTGKRYYLCGTGGKRFLGTRLDSMSKEAKAFDFLERGTLITVEKALENGQAMDIVQGTQVKVVASPGKPLPEDIKCDRE